MIEDGKPAHWPKMLTPPPIEDPGQAAVCALSEVRRLIIAHLEEDEDWRLHHAETDYIVNVVAGLCADSKAIVACFMAGEKQLEPLREKIKRLEEDLAESKRPFTAQMQMQNNTITRLNEEIARLTLLLGRKGDG